MIGFLLTQACIPLNLLINYGDGFKLIALEISPNLYRIFEVAYWLEGPLLLWYTRSLVYRNYRLGRIDILFVAPAAMYMLWLWFDFFQMRHEEKYALLAGYEAVTDGSLERHLSGFIREVMRVAFSVLCLIDINHCRQQIRKQYSNVEDIDFGWLNFLVIGFMVIRVWAIFVSLALILSAHTSFSFDVEFMGLTGNYTTFILVSALIFRSLSQSSMFEGVETREQTDAALIESEKTEIDPQLIEKLEEHMEDAKPYLANILTLEQLAKQIEMPSRTLSNVINRHYQRNFFEFINQYRVDEAKRILADPEQNGKTMIEVMADCGFNSKATFNTFFKKLVGCTPSQFRANSTQTD